MAKLPNWLMEGVFKRRVGRTPEELNLLRDEFQSRFDSFKMLIGANRITLEKMAEIEERLHGDVPLSINFLRSRVSTISRNVYKMVEYLSEISPGKYDVLFRKFDEIEGKLAPFLASNLRKQATSMTAPLSSLEITDADQVGEKMATLGEIHGGLGLTIPEGFVITADAYWQFIEANDLKERIVRLSREADLDRIDGVYALSRSIKSAIQSAPLPRALEKEIEERSAWLAEKVGPDTLLAVRSSAQGEDLPGKSCAGMYTTLLGIGLDNVASAYKEVLASKYEARAIMYRLNYGIREEEMAMCVGCMPLIRARAGGVAYSRNPSDIEDLNAMIHSVFGLPGPVADGTAESDLFVVSRGLPMDVLESRVAKKVSGVFYEEGVGPGTSPLEKARWEVPSLGGDQIRELAKQIFMIEEYFGTPQDVEWALGDNGCIIFLQSRVLLQRKQQSDESPLKKLADSVEVLAEGAVTASQGAAAGPVHLVRQEWDIMQFPKGGVLVASQPLPDWAVALKNVAAVVTEQGGMAGHLANVARELHIPALFGVKDALTKFESGQEVTVDATRKAVYDGRVDQVIQEQEKAEHKWVDDSPVYSMLETMAKHITPLHLLNADDPATFTPDRCTTLHDITRFCHEKSVQDMFRFGEEHRFPERAAKRLHVSVPTQFWVIDLHDGFKDKIQKQKYVKLDDIVSVPMLALWWGMMTIPWVGPPVDARGFLEVLMESTSNPALNPSMPSPYSERNYFMVTKKYCSCQTRFGYHFSTVEALVGERRQENFVSFHFRGGAANETRRQRRVKLVADILEQFGFRVHVVRDSVRARLEKYDVEFMETGLKVVGYMMFHTRQLDMVLKNQDAYNRYRNKILKELESMDCHVH